MVIDVCRPFYALDAAVACLEVRVVALPASYIQISVARRFVFKSSVELPITSLTIPIRNVSNWGAGGFKTRASSGTVDNPAKDPRTQEIRDL